MSSEAVFRVDSSNSVGSEARPPSSCPTHSDPRLQNIQPRRRGFLGFCRTCVGGFYGCRWRRHVPPPSTKSDVAWFVVLVLAFLIITISFYFWLVMENDEGYFDSFLFEKIGARFRWYLMMIVIASLAFVHFALLMLTSIFHQVVKLQMYMHVFHRILVIFLSVVLLVIMIVVGVLEKQQWELFRISLHMTAPFIQVAAVVTITALTWLIAIRWTKTEKKVIRVIVMLVYLAVLFFLYLCPLLITSPCICHNKILPKRPGLFAHRGASHVAPENTMAAFNHAVKSGCDALETDVTITSDNIPVIMHDDTLLRTTDVDDIFPGRAKDRVSTFTYDELQKLNAGKWFVKNDPYGTLHLADDKTKAEYGRQKIPTADEVFAAVKAAGIKIMFDIKDGGINGTTVPLLLDQLNTSGIDRSNIYWFGREVALDDFTLVVGQLSPDPQELKKWNYTAANVRFDYLSPAEVRNLRESGIEVIIWTVNAPWLFSYFWCVGVDYVTTNRVDLFKAMGSPVWHMQPTTYLIMWITVDVVSFILVFVIWTVYIYRHVKSMTPLEEIPMEAGPTFAKTNELARNDADNSWMDSPKEEKGLT